MTATASNSEEVVLLPSAGETIVSILTTPAFPAGAGAVILAGGRYEQSSGRNQVGRRLAVALADAGIHSIRLDYRGVGDSTGELAEFALHRPNISDAVAALDQLSERGVRRAALIGDCFGARTALATAARDPRCQALVLVSLPWRNLTRGNRKAAVASSELSVGKILRKGATRRVLTSLGDPTARRVYAQMLASKITLLHAKLRRRLTRSDLEPWVSQQVLSQLDDAAHRHLPTLIIYGEGPLEEYSHDYESARRSRIVSRIMNSQTIEVRSLPQPIAGYRNVQSQRDVIAMSCNWLSDRFRRDEGS